MAHEILPGPHPNIVIVRGIGDVESGDLTVSDEIGLNEGRPLYLLVDISRLQIGLPENFLEGARNSYINHKNMHHAAIYSKSALFNTLTKAVSKLLRRQDRFSIHNNYDAAMAHLQELVKKAGL